MRVLFGVHALPSDTYGGTELYTKRLAEELTAKGHEAAVATPSGTDEDVRDAAVYELPEPSAQPADGVGMAEGAGVVQPAVEARFADVLEEFRPDVVHLQHFKRLSAGIPSLCAERRVPCLATLHDFWTLCHREQLARPDGTLCAGPDSVEKCAACYADAAARQLRNAIADGATERVSPADPALGGCADGPVARRTARLAEALESTDRLVAPSAFLRDVFVDYGVAPAKIVHRRNGIRVDRFEDAGFDPDGPLRVGYAGRVAREKGVHLLIEAFRSVDTDAELHVYGEFDPHGDAYHARLATRADDRTRFHGRYDDQATPFAAVDVFVLPSVWYENSPLVVQEAFASRLPVVTADIGGMAELVTDGVDGLTFAVGDADALADRLKRLATDPSLVAQLRDGIEEPKRLSAHAEELLRLYEEMAGTPESIRGRPSRTEP